MAKSERKLPRIFCTFPLGVQARADVVVHVLHAAKAVRERLLARVLAAPFLASDIHRTCETLMAERPWLQERAVVRHGALISDARTA